MNNANRVSRLEICLQGVWLIGIGYLCREALRLGRWRGVFVDVDDSSFGLDPLVIVR